MARGKENVNIEKLKGAEQSKYEIYHAVKAILPKSQNWQQFEDVLQQQGISIEYKLKGQTDEVQGVSFKKGEYSFKGSDVDRTFSYGKLNTHFGESPIPEQQQIATPKETGNSVAGNIASVVGDALSAVGCLFDIQPSNQDENEAEYLRQQALKKKPERRRGIRR